MDARRKGHPKYWSVPRCWPGETVVVVGAGPSLTTEQTSYCRGKARMIVVNNAYEMAPWADWLWATDWRWWQRYGPAREDALPSAFTFGGVKITCSEEAGTFPEMLLLRNTGETGYDPDPSAIRTGKNGGSVAIQLAIKAGASRIVLLGIDMQGRHFHDHYPDKWNCVDWRSIAKAFQGLVDELAARDIYVINCAPNSALPIFRQERLTTVL